MKIGSLKLKNNLFLSPMVDVTDLPYRLICRKFGCGMAYTEMIYVDAALHENPNTMRMMKTCKEDSPVGLQITGDRIEEFEEFVKRVNLWREFDLIDLNCGCPSLRVAGKSGAGSFLMNSPEKIGKIVKVLKRTGKFVTVKVRLGFDRKNVLEVVRIAEMAGAKAVTVHARMACDGGRVPADWSWIEKVKKSSKIPVIGNGDVRSGADAKRMLDETGCDGIMVGRAAIGNPQIFEEILSYLCGREFKEKKSLNIFLDYVFLAREIYGDSVELKKIKYIGGKFLKAMSGAAKLREEFHSLEKLKDIEMFVTRLI